jgi:hypothetical protein
MLKKKVVIKNKKSGPAEPQPKRVPTSRVYTLNKPSVLPKKSTYIVNNMVQLKITLSDIDRLESSLGHKGLLHGIQQSFAPVAWNSTAPAAATAFPVGGDGKASSSLQNNPFKSLIKRKVTNITTERKANRKDLIINSGVKRNSKPILQIYSHGWPAHSGYACWYCCHSFNTTPVGIPQLLVNMEFHCYGNFCSYNCAKRYLRPETEDDIAMLQTTNDTFIDDDLGERMQLLELLYHIETGSPLNQPIKPASKRLTLAMFGGNKTIDEFRLNFANNDSYHVFRSPLVPISYQIEECNDKTEKKRRNRVSLDTVKIERAFSELAEKARKYKNGNGLGKKKYKAPP